MAGGRPPDYEHYDSSDDEENSWENKKREEDIPRISDPTNDEYHLEEPDQDKGNYSLPND